MRSLPDPGFAGDDGTANPTLGTALGAYDVEPDSRERWLAVMSALPDARLLVPVVATPGGRAASGASGQSRPGTDMAAVLMKGRSGRTALLAFTGLASMAEWDATARPVPVTPADAASAALQNGAEALLLDVAGPVLFVVEDDDLGSLAAGHRLVQVAGSGWGWVSAG